MKPESRERDTTVLELVVNNHAGTLSHVCGLFARRAFNLDAIVCLPMGDERYSRIWLRVREIDRLDLLENQLRRLHDVHAVDRSGRHDVFDGIDAKREDPVNGDTTISRMVFDADPASTL